MSESQLDECCTIIEKTILEFTMILGVPANCDNTLTFFGFTNIQAATRASQDIVGFGLLADVLQTISFEAVSADVFLSADKKLIKIMKTINKHSFNIETEETLIQKAINL